MSLSRSLQRLIASIAALAILLGPLSPAFARALAADQGGEWVQICTMQGMKTVQLDIGDGDPSTLGGSTDVCPFCAGHGPQSAPPPVVAAVILVRIPAEPVPIAFLDAPRTLHAWVTAQPRAPPFSA